MKYLNTIFNLRKNIYFTVICCLLKVSFPIDIKNFYMINIWKFRIAKLSFPMMCCFYNYYVSSFSERRYSKGKHYGNAWYNGKSVSSNVGKSVSTISISTQRESLASREQKFLGEANLGNIFYQESAGAIPTRGDSALCLKGYGGSGDSLRSCTSPRCLCKGFERGCEYRKKILAQYFRRKIF